jgi:hypothetical protein
MNLPQALSALAEAKIPLSETGVILSPKDNFFCVTVADCSTPGGWTQQSCDIADLLEGAAIEVDALGTGLQL